MEIVIAGVQPAAASPAAAASCEKHALLTSSSLSEEFSKGKIASGRNIPQALKFIKRSVGFSSVWDTLKASMKKRACGTQKGQNRGQIVIKTSLLEAMESLND